MISEEKIQALVNEELEEAKKKHGEYLNSNHEKYAVMLEEYEEAEEEMQALEDDMTDMWELIKGDAFVMAKEKNERIKDRAMSCIQELIQVCAMCDKGVKNE